MTARFPAQEQAVVVPTRGTEASPRGDCDSHSCCSPGLFAGPKPDIKVVRATGCPPAFSVAGLSRREFLGAAVAAGAAAGGPWHRQVLAEASDPFASFWPRTTVPLVDSNVTLGRWPARRLPLDETPALVAKLRRLGVRQAWAGSFEGVWHRDQAAVNARLADQCRRHGRSLLRAFGSINPTLPDWREELRRCRENHRMAGIRLYPNYHGYRLDEPVFGELLGEAASRGLIVQLALSLEDERMQAIWLRVPPVDPVPLTALLPRFPNARLVLLNWCRELKVESAAKLAGLGRVYFDLAMVEGVAGVSNLLCSVPVDRLLFGSHAPFFYPESAVLKLRESELTAGQLACIGMANSMEVWGGL